MDHKKKHMDEKPKWLKNRELMKIAGMVFSIAGIFSIAGGPIWGSFSDKIGAQKTLLIAWIFAMTGDLIPIFSSSAPGFIISSIIWGASIGGMVTLIQVKGAEQVPLQYVSAAIGFISIFYAIGQAVGPGISGSLIDHTGGYVGAYVFGAIVYAFGFLLTLILKSQSTKA